MSGIAKRVTRLSDGRELIYFDDADTALRPERKIDERPPAPRPPAPELRLDPLTGEWVSIATARQNRAFLPPDDLDPLAPSTPGRPTEIPDNFDVAVFENKSPSFGPGLPPPGDPAADPAGGRIEVGASRPGYGRCEVVCFSPEREGSFGTQTPSRARTVIEAWAQRTASAGTVQLLLRSASGVG